jgi:hypothetical protein
MALIRDKEIRRLISDVFKVGRKNFPDASHEISLKQLDEMSSVLGEFRREANNHAASYLQGGLSTAYLSILALTVTCFAVGPDNSDPPIPKDWLDASGKPDPNQVLPNLLLQIVNYLLAIVRLVEDGLDNPARCVLRALNELSGQFLILCSERAKLSAYARTTTPAEAKQIWYELFAKKNGLEKSLRELESRIGLPSAFAAQMRSYREEMNGLHSQAVHHSFNATIIGAYAGDFQEEERLHFALLGKASRASRLTLESLNTTLSYTFLMFLRIIEKLHGFDIPRENKLWREVLLFAVCISKVSSSA